MSKKIVLSWGKNIRRSKTLAATLGADDRHVVSPFKGNGVFFKLCGYLWSSVVTIMVILYRRPVLVVVSLPPVFCVYILAFYKLIRGQKVEVIYDLHNGVLRREWKFWPALGWLMRSSGQVFAHNIVVKPVIDDFFAVESIVVPDPLPVVDFERLINLKQPDFFEAGKINVVVPLSYAADEPISEILAAAELVAEHTNFIMTGPSAKYFSGRKVSLPENIYLTGYLSNEEYDKTLLDADVVLCLTTDASIQMCAIVEAIAFEKPFICSDSALNVASYSDIALFSPLNADGIASTLDEFLTNGGCDPLKIKGFKQAYNCRIDKQLQGIIL